jgi:hypothetical protein
MPPGNGPKTSVNEFPEKPELLVRRTLVLYALACTGYLRRSKKFCGTDFVRVTSYVDCGARVKTYAEASTSSWSWMRVGSILTPGPMVELTVTLMR